MAPMAPMAPTAHGAKVSWAGCEFGHGMVATPDKERRFSQGLLKEACFPKLRGCLWPCFDPEPFLNLDISIVYIFTFIVYIYSILLDIMISLFVQSLPCIHRICRISTWGWILGVIPWRESRRAPPMLHARASTEVDKDHPVRPRLLDQKKDIYIIY